MGIRGEFHPEQNRTRVAIVIRHGLLLVAFGWLLVAIGLVSLAGTWGGEDRRFGDTSPLVGAAVLLAFGLLWHLRLWWDVRRVRREMVVLMTPRPGGGRTEPDADAARPPE
jgi:hypothetical protein